MSISVVVDRVTPESTERVLEAEFEKDKLLIGRSGSSDIVLAAPDVSGRHAELSCDQEGALYIKDLRSANGTFVEAGQVSEEPHPVRIGERILIGEFVIAAKFRRHVVPEPPPAPVTQTPAPKAAPPPEPATPENAMEEVLRVLEDPECDALYVLGPVLVYEERQGVILPLPLELPHERTVNELLRTILTRGGGRLDQVFPEGEVCLKGGERVRVFQSGAGFVLRKPPRLEHSLVDLLGAGFLTAQMAHTLQEAVEARKNVLVCGGPRSGKTTFVSALCREFGSDERTVLIESCPQLSRVLLNAFTLAPERTSGPGIGGVGLLRQALSTFPQRLVIDECPEDELLELLCAIHQGTRGVLLSVPAASTAALFHLLELFLCSGPTVLTGAAAREQICSAFDLIVLLERGPDGHRRVRSVSELSKPQSGEHLGIKPLHTAD